MDQIDTHNDEGARTLYTCAHHTAPSDTRPMHCAGNRHVCTHIGNSPAVKDSEHVSVSLWSAAGRRDVARH